jgi:HSP20 family protein
MQYIRYQTQPTYNPASSFSGLRDEMDRLFQVAFPVLGPFTGESRSRAFPIDLYQDKESFVVRAEIPGFRKEDLNVEVADGVLTLVAQRKTDTAEKTAPETTLVKEDLRLSRSISLPEEIATDKIGARYENGVLTVTLPKREEVKPKQIAVEVK